MKGQLPLVTIVLFHLTGALGTAAELTEHSVLETRVTGFVPTTTTTVGRMVRTLRAAGTRVHFEAFPKHPVKDAIRRADGAVTGWRFRSFSLDAKETSDTSVKAILETLCIKDPRYRYQLTGTKENVAILIVPIDGDTSHTLTNRVTIQEDIRVASESVYNILLSPTGRHLARPHLSTSSLGRRSDEWTTVKVTLHVRKGWTLRDLLTETANAMGKEWYWNVWGATGSRQVRFHRMR